MPSHYMKEVVAPIKTRSARREATRFVESRISYREDNPIPGFLSLFK
jgi:hypothetical protein